MRKETDADIDTIHRVNTIAFDRDNEAKLVDLLRQSPHFIPELSIVAILNNEIVGHILFTSIIIESKDGKESESLALAPMAVLPEYQQKGIGSQLVAYGLKQARELGYGSVIVLGHEHYYPRFGFVPASRHNISCPFEVPDDAFMALELIPNALHNIEGTVRYSKEFEMV